MKCTITLSLIVLSLFVFVVPGSAQQYPKGKKRELMHGPFSIDSYFQDIWEEDYRVELGRFLSYQNFRRIDGLRVVYDMTGDHSNKDSKKHVNDIVAQLKIILEEKRRVSISPPMCFDQFLRHFFLNHHHAFFNQMPIGMKFMKNGECD